MPSILRSRVALVAMLGAFMIPLGLSSLRGLTHILTCQQEAKTPFSVFFLPNGEATMTSSTRITRDKPKNEEVCAGLSMNVSVRALEGNRLEVRVPIRNTSVYQWRGTVGLRLGGDEIPVDIGVINPGATETDAVTLQLKPGTSELNGELLIGP